VFTAVQPLYMNFAKQQSEIQTKIFWDLMMEMEVARFSKNVGILLQHYTVSEPRRPQYESSPQWKPQILQQSEM